MSRVVLVYGLLSFVPVAARHNRIRQLRQKLLLISLNRLLPSTSESNSERTWLSEPGRATMRLADSLLRTAF